MKNISKALSNLDQSVRDRDKSFSVPFETFLQTMLKEPRTYIRNVFQIFCDMITSNVGEGIDEYPDDPESINFKDYDFSKLFVDGLDNPFFTDRLFANRMMSLKDAMEHGAQQNKIYIFEGPHGSGKSTFLNNLLLKFEEYANSEAGKRYEAVWILDRKTFGDFTGHEYSKLAENVLNKLRKHSHIENKQGSAHNKEDEISSFVNNNKLNIETMSENAAALDSNNFSEDQIHAEATWSHIEIPCPSHDHPLLMVPKHYRRTFFDDLFKNDKFKYKLFSDKEYEWIFKNNPCTICSSLYQALLQKYNSPKRVFEMLYIKPFSFNRRLGEGISVFNPGDQPQKQKVLSNSILQRRINGFLGDSNKVKYIFSRYAKTNNGIYVLMDIKTHNKDRLIDLHNIISEGIHKVENIEENVNSLFIALINPEDKKNIQDKPSFTDRIEYVKIPYVLDLRTEVNIYKNVFGSHIDLSFLPRVLHNFARVIISSRINRKSEALLGWIDDPKKYGLYCDENLHLLKMEVYAGLIPSWLDEDDRKRFTAKRRRKIVMESEKDGIDGFSGRDSLKIFNDFLSTYAKKEKLINMTDLYSYFTKTRKDLAGQIPVGFLDSLIKMYNYTILQEVKESLYYYNEEQISKDIQNYMFAVNFEIGTTGTCNYTNEKIDITEDFFKTIENHLLGSNIYVKAREVFRKDTQKEYTSKTLTQEIMVDNKEITGTELYKSLHERYVYNLKEKSLDPFFENENFRRAIKDYNTDDFKTYDKMIRKNVTFLMKNLTERHKYSRRGAKEVCMYVIDNELALQFNKSKGV